MQGRIIHLLVAISVALSIKGISDFPKQPSLLPQYVQLAGFPRTEPGTIDFAGPAVLDINDSGGLEILVADSSGCVYGWDAAGNPLANFPIKPFGNCSSGNRINSMAVGDIDGDNLPEIVAGTAGSGESSGQRGKVYAWNHNGSIISGWPREMEWNTAHGGGRPEVYSVALANITGGPALEVLAGTSNNASDGGSLTEAAPNMYVWTGDARLLRGFPTWYRRAGVYGMVGAGDLNNDRCMEVITPRDHRWLHVYAANGAYLPGWPVETYVYPVPSNNDPYIEFTRNSPSMADLNNDGLVEVIIAGRVKLPESQTGGETVIVNSGVLVLEPDGSRLAGWENAKLGDGPPLVDSFGPSQAPALGDMNNDGQLEVVVTLMDGTARAYRATGELLWKHNFAAGRKLFASEPVIGDINGDGFQDIVFGTYSPDGSANSSVSLIALDRNGSMIQGFPLPLPNESGDKRGIRAAPALADLDLDGKVEIIAGSWSGVVYAWDLTAPYNPNRMDWSTARHDNTRSGYFPRGSADEGERQVTQLNAATPAFTNLTLATEYNYLPLLVNPGQTTQTCP